eukprot:tig00000396_g24901.t1
MENTKCRQYLTDPTSEGIKESADGRLRKINVQSTAPAELLKIENVDKEVMGPIYVVVPSFPATVTGGFTVDDVPHYLNSDPFAPFPEKDYIVFWAKEPPRNAYTPTAAWTSPCIACDAGYYLPYTGATLCSLCPPMTWSPPGALGSCQFCAPPAPARAHVPACRSSGSHRKLKPNAQARRVKYLPTMAPVAKNGASNYTLCAPGHVPSGSKMECLPCSAGTYQRNDVCERCPAAMFSASGGSVECLPDVISFIFAGTFQRGESCEWCPINYVAPTAGSSACIACQPGFASSADSQTCIPCMSGTYRSADMVSCISVPMGAIAPAASSSYVICATGTVPNPASDECMPCGKGAYESNRVCRPCAGNTINPEVAATSCTPCPPGSVASANKENCDYCLPGFYRSAAMGECAFCPQGAYSSGGAASCRACPAGYISTPDRTGCEPCKVASLQS